MLVGVYPVNRKLNRSRPRTAYELDGNMEAVYGWLAMFNNRDVNH
jgi:hypothetical protein